LEKIRIQFTLFSAFYSPLIATMSGGFLKQEGLDSEWSVAPPGVSALVALENGSAHVVQSALSQGFSSLNKGETPPAVHFAQINEMDGFFLTGRKADPDFTWKKLEGAEVVMFKGGQPLDMFKYACHKAGIDFGRIKPIGLGSAGEIDKARIRSSYRPMAWDTSLRRSENRSAPWASRASRRSANGSRATWRRPSRAPTGRPATT
jgi:NitT/TauT family transport system substrate-binding protein